MRKQETETTAHSSQKLQGGCRPDASEEPPQSVKYRYGCKSGIIDALQRSMLVRGCLRDLVSQFLAKHGKLMGCTNHFLTATTSKSMSRNTRAIEKTKIPAASVFCLRFLKQNHK